MLRIQVRRSLLLNNGMESLHEKQLHFLELTANKLRQEVIRMVSGAGSGHQGGPLGSADIFTALYFHVMCHDPKLPHWTDRDRLVVSCGHYCPVLYAALAHAGYFKVEELKTLRQMQEKIARGVSAPGTHRCYACTRRRGTARVDILVSDFAGTAFVLAANQSRFKYRFGIPFSIIVS